MNPLSIQSRKGNEGRGLGWMAAKELFHPDHVVPSAKFISAPAELPRQVEAKMGMKFRAVSGEVFVFCFRISNAGIEVLDILGHTERFQSLI